MKILVVEDDAELGSILVRGLEEENFRIELCAGGIAALRKAQEDVFDLILLDVMLPDLSGFEIVKEWRQRAQETPVLMLTARDSVSDIARGLDSGADDYLTKPFSFVELLSRIRALERRTSVKPRSILEVGDLVLDVSAQRALRRGRNLSLSLTEFRLLEALARHPGQIVPRKVIVANVWGDRRDVETNTLDAFVRLLRRKLERDSPEAVIHTHRGIGYSIGAEISP